MATTLSPGHGVPGNIFSGNTLTENICSDNILPGNIIPQIARFVNTAFVVVEMIAARRCKKKRKRLQEDGSSSCSLCMQIRGGPVVWTLLNVRAQGRTPKALGDTLLAASVAPPTATPKESACG
jgi:hypothetical protein